MDGIRRYMEQADNTLRLDLSFSLPIHHHHRRQIHNVQRSTCYVQDTGCRERADGTYPHIALFALKLMRDIEERCSRLGREEEPRSSSEADGTGVAL